jgi:hypothetical protein
VSVRPARELERIEPPPYDVFVRDYALPRRPVVIRGLYAGQPVAAFDSLAATLSAAGEQTIRFRDRIGAGGIEWGEISLASFFDPARPASERERGGSATSAPLPSWMTPLFELPPYARMGARDDLRLIVYLGRGQSVTPLHYDVEGHPNLHTVLFGRRRVLVAPARAAQKLQPLPHGARPSFSSVMLQSFSEPDRRAFCDFIGGYDVVLEAGETLFLPSLAWHSFEYLEASMSLIVRVGRGEALRALDGVRPLLMTSELHLFQGIADRVAGMASPDGASDAAVVRALRLLHDAADAARAGGREESRRLGDVLRETHRALCPDEFCAPYFHVDRERGGACDVPRAALPAGPTYSWRADDVPTMAPGVELARRLPPASGFVVMESHAVVFALTTDEDDVDTLALVFSLLRGARSIADIAREADADPDAVLEIVSSLAAEGWVLPLPRP